MFENYLSWAANSPFFDQVLEPLASHIHEYVHFLFGPSEILDAKRPESDLVNPEVDAPLQHFGKFSESTKTNSDGTIAASRSLRVILEGSYGRAYPFWWMVSVFNAFFLANVRLPSMMKATCLGMIPWHRILPHIRWYQRSDLFADTQLESPENDVILRNANRRSRAPISNAVV